MKFRRKVSPVLLFISCMIILDGWVIVLGTSLRSFNAVLEWAQQILRSVFGMELVELQSHAEYEKETNARDGINADDGKVTGVKKKCNVHPHTSSHLLADVFCLNSRGSWKQDLYPTFYFGPANHRVYSSH